MFNHSAMFLFEFIGPKKIYFHHEISGNLFADLTQKSGANTGELKA